MNIQKAAWATFSHAAALKAAEKNDPNFRNLLIGYTVAQIFAYVPGIGVIIGVARMILGAGMKGHRAELKPFWMLRGAAEIAGLGPLLLIVDLIGTGILLHAIASTPEKIRL